MKVLIIFGQATISIQSGHGSNEGYALRSGLLAARKIDGDTWRRVDEKVRIAKTVSQCLAERRIALPSGPKVSTIMRASVAC
jgi:hypothetical protein